MRRRDTHALSDINIANLVDVMLVLLIIFMITAPMLQSGVDVKLPQADLNGGQERPGIVVTVNESGSIYLDKYMVELKDLGSRLQAVINSKDSEVIYLKGDKDVSYGRMIEVVAEIKKAGITDVGLVIEPIKSAAK
ncbi:MAG: protein TolR [candidate division Zixibacteria bacterium CG_4_9_14_3_um_filter_46_8]|nr:MAG: protein TolR [candidate division Zixibacteria bacterium CG_4_9_14_3_um_filter_46_8]